MNKFVKFAVVALFAATLSACAGSGKIKWDNARQVKEGMTQQEITKLMGDPYSVTSVDDGEKWIWVYVNMLTGARESATLTFVDGKVVKAFNVPDSF